MKALLIALAIFAAPQAFANSCNPYPVTINSETGETVYVYPCGTNYKVTHRACNEGEVAYDTVLNGNEYVNVALVCKNGSFAPKAAKVKHRGCTEGQIAYDTVLEGNEYVNVALVCRNGRFVR